MNPWSLSPSLLGFTAQGVKPADIAKDEDMVALIASLKYIRVNYQHFTSPEHYMYEALSHALNFLSSMFAIAHRSQRDPSQAGAD